MQVSIEIKDTVGEIINKILKEFRTALNSAVRSAIPNIKRRVGDLTKNLVMATPEFDSILRGQLRQELGLINPDYAMLQILDKLSQDIKITFTSIKIVNEELEGSLLIEIIKDDYSDILRIPEATYYSKDNQIPWLEWLLFRGNSIIIADYRIRYFKRPIGKSRSGDALMFSNKQGISWQVPAQFSGTQDDNFITRAFTNHPDSERLIGEILEEEITSFLI